MNKKTFFTIKIATASFLAAIVAVSVNYGNWYLPVLAIIAAFVLLYFTKTKVKGVVADERDYKIAGQASYLAMTSYTIVATITGLIVYISGRENPVIFAVGNVLLYSVLFLMLTYAILFKIYAKRSHN
jgi:uncharacterized membrane protein